MEQGFKFGGYRSHALYTERNDNRRIGRTWMVVKCFVWTFLYVVISDRADFAYFAAIDIVGGI